MEVFAPLGEDLARDIIAHRKGLKCPLTVRGAKGLLKEYLLAGNPIQAAEYHLNQGWRGFDHTWVRRDNRQAQNKGALANAAADYNTSFGYLDASPRLPSFGKH